MIYSKLVKSGFANVTGNVHVNAVNSSLLDGHAVHFATAFIHSESESFEVTDFEEPATLISIASRDLAKDPAQLPRLLLALKNVKLLADMTSVITRGAPATITGGVPYLTLDMINDRIADVLNKNGYVDKSIRLIISAIIGRVLTEFGIIYAVAGSYHVKKDTGLIPSWDQIRTESVHRLLETAITSVSTSNVIPTKKIAGSILLAPVQHTFSEIQAALLRIQTQLRALDTLGAAAFMATQSLADPHAAFGGILSLPAVDRLSRNYTFVSQYVSQLSSLDVISTTLSCVPQHTIADDIERAASAITESGRLREIQLSEFVPRTERLILEDLTGSPLQVLVAPRFDLGAVRANVSMVSSGNVGRSKILVPMNDLEDGLNTFIPSAMKLASGGILGSFHNIAAFVASTTYTSDRLDCCQGAELFHSPEALVSLGADDVYVEHLAVAVADNVIVKGVVDATTLCVKTEVSIGDTTTPLMGFVSTVKRRDQGHQLTMLNDQTFVTTSPSVLFAYGTDWDGYMEAAQTWQVGHQTLPPQKRSGEFYGQVINNVKDQLEAEEFLIPNKASSLSRELQVLVPATITGMEGLSAEVNIAEMLSGIDYSDSPLGAPYAHQLPILRRTLSSYFAFMSALPTSDNNQASEVTVAIASELEDMVGTPLVAKIVNYIKTKLLLSIDDCGERLKLRAAFKKQIVDAHLSLIVIRELLMKSQLITNDVYKLLSQEEANESAYSHSAVRNQLAGKLLKVRF